MRRRGGLLKPLIIVLLSIAIVVVAGILVYRIFFNRVYKSITLQAGADISVNDFMRSDIKGVPYEGELISYTPELNTHSLGKYKAKIKSGFFTYTSVITIVDEEVPAGVGSQRYVFDGYSLMPSDFVTNVSDDTEVNCSYINLPSFSVPGDSKVEILMTDAAGNTTLIDSTLRTCPLVSRFDIEAGSQLPSELPDNYGNMIPIQYSSTEKIDEFCNTFNMDAIYVDWIDTTDLPILDSDSLNHIGVYRTYVDIDGLTYVVFFNVFDSTAPDIVGAADLKLFIGDKPEPQDFITSVSDSTDTDLFFEGEINTDTPTADEELREITVVASDEYGNTTSIPCRYSVQVDEEPPLIMGVSNLTTVVGEPFSFKRGITVTDNHDTDLEVSVNSDEVDLNTLGTYTLYYTATDSSGNTSTRSCDLTVVESMPKEVTEEEVLELAQEVLDSILTDDMTELDKVTAIYWYVYDNVHYNEGFDPSSWLNAAYKGLTTGMGDCYVSASTAQALFTAAGIPNMMISKIYNGYSHHFWNLVDIGEGWHHFDATRRMHDQVSHFIYYTDEDMMAYSSIHYGSHNYDPELYPEIA
ncbi:MAG: DUF5011 domain-containing protein [Clostridia bacterium]|nr:DUF5011 domain-containing protein [Clostridia bacterium]